MTFHFDSWLIYFYFYCICGWIFESTYVSLKTKKLTNRGFMKGPWLPLYGSGAIVILLVTLPVKQFPVAVYFVGAIAATALEYVTGVVMLKLFKVRYWDYSYRKIQFQGHICLVSSIAWGFLSLIMVYLVHEPVVRFIALWNEEVLSILTFLITIVIVFDFANAFRNAMDLRALIIQAEEIRRRLDEALEERKQHLSQTVSEAQAQIEQALEERAEENRKALNKYKEQFEEAVNETKEKVEEAAAERRERIERTIAELTAARDSVLKSMEKPSRQLLLHNPGSGFKGLEEEAMEIKKRLLAKKKEQ